MTLPRAEVRDGLVEELGRFGELIRSLDEAGWAAPTRCAGWTAADVAAHVVGTLADVTAGRLEGLTDPGTVARQVAERRGRAPADLADELATAGKGAQDILALIDDAAWAGPAPGGLDFTLGEGVEALWYDAYVHGDDIRAATGRPPVRGPGLRASVAHLADLLTKRGWGPATLRLDGTGEWPVSGGGAAVTGDPLEFVLAATGRTDPAPLGLDETVNVYRA